MSMPKPTASFVDVHGLEPDAVKVIELIVQRMRRGQEQYGRMNLSTEARDLTHEANEEFLDAAVYLAMRTLKDERAQQLSQLEHRVVRAHCTPREIDWLDHQLPLLLHEIRDSEARGDKESARALSLRALMGRRDILEAVRKRMDGDA